MKNADFICRNYSLSLKQMVSGTVAGALVLSFWKLVPEFDSLWNYGPCEHWCLTLILSGTMVPVNIGAWVSFSLELWSLWTLVPDFHSLWNYGPCEHWCLTLILSGTMIPVNIGAWLWFIIDSVSWTWKLKCLSL